MQLGSGLSSESLCVARVLSSVCWVLELVSVDVESDVWPLCHVTPARLQEPMPPVKTPDSNVESFFCGSFCAVQSSSLLVLFRRYLSLFHLDGIKAVMKKLQPL